MIYIVSGYMRSGTSMMMRALMAGGMDALYDEARNEMNAKHGDETYQPNAGGFYEPGKVQSGEWDFPRKHDGKLIKVLFGGVPRLAVAKYRVVVMLRDQEEIRQSYEAFFRVRSPKIFAFYPQLMEDLKAHVLNRRDMSMTVLNYRDVINDPLTAFVTLQEAGWPIDAQAAAAVVDPQQYRFRKERLVEGI